MGEPKYIIFADGHKDSGIQIEYIKRRDVLNIHGWYDHFVGIEGQEISFSDFCDRLGIDLNKRIKSR